MTKALEFKLTQARARIVMRDVFFASILMDMEPVVDASKTDNCAVDGKSFFINPEWAAEQSAEQISHAMRKGALHVALAHPLRRGPAREVGKWTTACDQAALNIMVAEKMPVPAECQVNPTFAGMTADEIYKHLQDAEDKQKQQQQDQQQDQNAAGGAQGGQQGQGDAQQGDQPGDGDNAAGGQPSGAPGHPVDGADMNNPAEVSQAKAENDQRTIRAAMAGKQAGTLPGFAKEMIDAIKAKGSDWRDHFQLFINDRCETRTSWRKPNRRFLHNDMYLPGRNDDGIDTLVFIVDTSGSMSADLLRACANQIEAARESVGISQTVIIQIDTCIEDISTYDHGEPLPSDMTFGGRGGTKLDLAFEAAEDYAPSAVVCLTDGHIPTVEHDPGCPVFMAVEKGGGAGATAFDATHVEIEAA